jgi:two-component system LytT family response regulator/two-component system response regulator LytT
MQGRATPVTISAVIVDDERLARDELAYLLEEHPDIEIVGRGSNGLEALELIVEMEPDLVFLDVNMPGLDGLGIIQKLQEKKIPLPFFVMATAYEQYAVEAFRLAATDYLLKPMERERLAVTLDRVRRALEERSRAESAVESGAPAARNAAPRSRIVIRKDNRNLVVDAQDIVYATIDNGVISVATAQMEGESNYRTIEELQANLDAEMFWRVHRSWLVNVNRIKEVIPWFKSSFQLRMDDRNQTEVPVSRVQTRRLRTLFKL